MIAEREHIEQAAASMVEAIVEDRAHTPLRTDRDADEAVFAAVAGELRPLTFQVAEMAEREPHQLVAAAEYLHGLLEREPLRSGPTWEAQRVVLGLFLMGLTSALARVEAITADERAALIPAYQRAAREAVVAAFDPTYVPEPDEAQPEEETATTTATEGAPQEAESDAPISIF